MSYQLIHGDCLNILKTLSDKSINCCVTSPPYYGLRDYGVNGQVGLENTPDEYVNKLVEIFREVLRVLRDDGTLWMNLGDSYASNFKGTGGASTKQLSNAGSRYEPRKINHNVKEKDLIGIPWMVAFALRADGWYLRSDIIWSKPNPMPESVQDRPTKAHEYIFLLSKSQNYYYDNEAIKEDSVGLWTYNQERRLQRVSASGGALSGGTGDSISGGSTRNKRTVWTVTTKPYAEAHFATYPPDLIQPCVLAGCPEGGTVLDPFNGSGTTGQVALQNGRKYIGIELNSEYIELTKRRLSKVTQQPSLFTAQPTQWEPVAMFGDD